MRYATARFKANQKEVAYRIYVTDSLKVLTENSATNKGAKSMSIRYAEMIVPKKEETRTAQDIINKVRKVLEG